LTTLHVAGPSFGAMYLSNLGAGLNEKHWYLDAESIGGVSYFFWGANNDAANSGSNYARVARTGNAVNNWTIFPSLVLANEGPGGGLASVRSAAGIPLTVKGVAGQTGDLTRWVDGSGTVLDEVGRAS